MTNNLKQAKTQLQSIEFIKTAKYREQQGKAHRQGGHPELLVFEKAFISEMRQRLMPFYAHNIVRGEAYQNKLLAQGRSKASYGKSPHNYGCAVDIVHSLHHWKIFEDKQSCKIIGHIGKEVAKRVGVDIVWGGDWDFWDPAHWELKYWKAVKVQYPSWDPYFLNKKSIYWKTYK